MYDSQRQQLILYSSLVVRISSSISGSSDIALQSTQDQHMASIQARPTSPRCSGNPPRTCDSGRALGLARTANTVVGMQSMPISCM